MIQFFVWLRSGWGQTATRLPPRALSRMSIHPQVASSSPRSLPGPSVPRSLPGPSSPRSLPGPSPRLPSQGSASVARPVSPIAPHVHRHRRDPEFLPPRAKKSRGKGGSPPCPMSPIVAPEFLPPPNLGFCLAALIYQRERESEKTGHRAERFLFFGVRFRFFSRAVRERNASNHKWLSSSARICRIW
jgi:hypothetical protein